MPRERKSCWGVKAPNAPRSSPSPFALQRRRSRGRGRRGSRVTRSTRVTRTTAGLPERLTSAPRVKGATQRPLLKRNQQNPLRGRAQTTATTPAAHQRGSRSSSEPCVVYTIAARRGQASQLANETYFNQNWERKNNCTTRNPVPPLIERKVWVLFTNSLFQSSIIYDWKMHFANVAVWLENALYTGWIVRSGGGG